MTAKKSKSPKKDDKQEVKWEHTSAKTEVSALKAILLSKKNIGKSNKINPEDK